MSSTQTWEVDEAAMKKEYEAVVDESKSSPLGIEKPEDDVDTKDRWEQGSDGDTVVPDDKFQSKHEFEDDNTSGTSESLISSTLRCSSSPSTPLARSSSPCPEFGAAVDPFETAVGNFVLAETLANITNDREVEDKTYEELVSNLFAVFESSMTRLSRVTGVCTRHPGALTNEASTVFWWRCFVATV
jgi:hypothetical protein